MPPMESLTSPEQVREIQKFIKSQRSDNVKEDSIWYKCH